jgi:hypothetical protein
VKRGVKQGCPLAPLLFIILIETIIFIINKSPLITTKAFADDLGFGFTDLQAALVHITRTVDLYCKASGANINQDKTIILHALPTTPDDNTTIDGSSWPKIKFKEKGKYLGMLFGNNLTVPDIFDTATTKFTSRIRSYRSIRDRLSITKRIIIANTFLVPIFSYLHQFYIIPHETIQTINTELQRFIPSFSSIPLAYFSYPTKAGGLKTRLRNITLANLAALGAAIATPLSFDPQTEHSAHHIDTNENMLISLHRHRAAWVIQDFIPNWVGDNSIKSLFSNLINSNHHIASCTHLHKKGKNWGGNTPTTNSANFIHNITSLPSSTPDSIRYNQILLYCNGLATKTRTRFFLHHQSLACLLCPDSSARSDSIHHLYNDCPTIRTAVNNIAALLNLPLINNISLLDHSMTRTTLSQEQASVITHVNHGIWLGYKRTQDLIKPSQQTATTIISDAITLSLQQRIPIKNTTRPKNNRRQQCNRRQLQEHANFAAPAGISLEVVGLRPGPLRLRIDED